MSSLLSILCRGSFSHQTSWRTHGQPQICHCHGSLLLQKPSFFSCFPGEPFFPPALSFRPLQASGILKQAQILATCSCLRCIALLHPLPDKEGTDIRSPL